MDDTDKPDAFILAKVDKQYGLSWTVTFTHELLEMLADPYISSAWQFSDTEFWGQEVCDAVEDDSLGYEIKIDGYPPVLVTDFQLPHWFIPGSAPKYDYRNHCVQPGEILKGGYMSVFVSGKGWTERKNFDGLVKETVVDDRSRPSAQVRVEYAEYQASKPAP